MKKITLLTVLLSTTSVFISCKKDKEEKEIKTETYNSTITAQRDLDNKARKSIILVDSLYVDLDNDDINDLLFETIDLNNFNKPPYTYEDNLAARVHPLNGTLILDNSTYGYADALDKNMTVDGNWSSKIGVLGTIFDAGQFEGAGVKYLGVKLNNSGKSYFGWVALNLSKESDTLKILNSGYNLVDDISLKAGEE